MSSFVYRRPIPRRPPRRFAKFATVFTVIFSDAPLRLLPSSQLLRDCPLPLEAAQVPGATAWSLPSEALSVLQDTQNLPLENLGFTVSKDARMPLEQPLQVSGGHPSSSEVVGQVRRDTPLSLESLGSTVRQDATQPVELLGGTVTELFPVPAEILYSASGVLVGQLESFSQLAQTIPLSLEASSQFVQAHPLASEIVLALPAVAWFVPAELLLTQAAAPLMSSEALSQVQETQPALIEFAGTFRQDDPVATELSSSIVRNHVLPTEVVALVSRDTGESQEVLSSAVAQVSEPAEILTSSTATSPASLEILGFTVSEVLQLPLEVLLQMTGQPSLPAELLQVAVGQILHPSETLIVVREDALSPEEVGSLNVQETAPLALESSSLQQSQQSHPAELVGSTLASSPLSAELSSLVFSVSTVSEEVLALVQEQWSLTQEAISTVGEGAGLSAETLGGTVTETISLSFEHIGSTISELASLPAELKSQVAEDARMPLIARRTLAFVHGRDFQVRSDTRTIYIGSDAQIWIVSP